VIPADAAAAAPPSPAASANVAAAIVPAIAPVTPPHANAAYLENPPPAYPPLSRRLGEQGRVMLRVHVSADGNADAIELKSSSGSARLDEAALSTVKRWRFVPARQGEQPVAAWTVIPITFSLKG
jgi:protein TonB